MQFRRSGQRDDRRRRLLADELIGADASRGAHGEPPAEPRQASRHKSEHYGDALFMDEQPRLTDLIPRRPLAFVLLLLAGLTVIVGLEALYSWMPDLAAGTTDGRVAALDLDSEGSLGAWFSSLTLLAASLAAMLVYSIRRHRADDYRGRYRVWLWAAGCWFLMATDESASLHEAFKEMMAQLTGTRLLGDGSIWWAIPYFLLLGYVGTRVLMDIWESRLSSAVFMLAGGCYGVAVIAQFGWILPESGARGVMLEEGAEMVGNLLVLTVMALFGRYVILDAEGLLPRREPKAKPVMQEKQKEQPAEKVPPARTAVATAATGSAAGRQVAIDPPHTAPRPNLARPETTDEPAEAEDDLSGGRAMTKAERKALRKRLEQQRIERQRQQRSNW